jgi:hypothetical protein
MVRIIAGVLALILAGNGVMMLLAPLPWYDAVPGVVATGPFNPHFVRDIGAAYLVAGLGVAWFGWRPREGWPALVAAAAFLAIHAAIHVYDATCGTRPLQDFVRDLGGVYVLAAVALLLALRKPQIPESQEA